MHKNPRTALICLLLAIAAPVTCFAAEPDFAQLEKNFRALRPEDRELIGPLFWLHGDDSPDRLQMYVAKVAEGGNGAFTTESRPHNDWLGEGWFRDVSICLDAAKKHGLKLWIFDEKWWPSQGVAGKVPARFAAKSLTAFQTNVTGPQRIQMQGFSRSNYIGAVAGRIVPDGGIDATSLVDLAGFIRGGDLAWNCPAGDWRVIRFTHKLAPGLGQGGGTQLSVDGMSRDCVDWFLHTVYDPHYERFKADFGKTIAGFFYDEPETRGDWGTELDVVLRERNIDWKTAYVAYKSKLSGDAQAAARYQYLDARAEAWGRTMYGGITRWCEARGVKSIGHFMEHANLYVNQDFCAGDMMHLQKYSSMGGIDAVFDQFVWGRRAVRDVPCWQTPKLGSSITHAYGKPDDIAMVEIFGARGQDLSYPEMKWWADHMQVSGINFLIPHSFNPRAPRDTDCPPYFYNGGFEPRWPLYRVFADYSSRVSLMLSGGRHVAPVALLSPGQSLHVGQGSTIDQLSEALQDARYDCDWIPYEVFVRDCRLEDQRLSLREENYKVVIVPPVEVIPYATLAKAKEFFDRGGIVIAAGRLPSKSATLGRPSSEIIRLRDALWRAEPSLAVSRQSDAGGRSYFLPAQPTPEQLARVLSSDAGCAPDLQLLGEQADPWLHVLHRVKAGRDVFFIANQNHTGPARTYRFQISAEGEPECWDPMRAEITSVPFQRHEKSVELALTMEPNESVLLVFQPTIRPLPSRIAGPSAGFRASIPIRPVPLPVPASPALDADMRAQMFDRCSWVWYPEGNPAEAAPPGARWFRQRVILPPGRTLRKAAFAGTADNSLLLFVNGHEAGYGDSSANGWRNPVELDITSSMHVGTNVLAIEAVNGLGKPNPAGLLGHFILEFTQGPMEVIPIDKSWKASQQKDPAWTRADFDDSAWPHAMEVASYGQGPWKRIGGRLTLSPAVANPFFGICDIPSSTSLSSSRSILELSDLQPETAARITVNGAYAGGLLSAPLRLDISRHLQPGTNTIRIEPFTPQSARLLIY